GQVEGGQVVVVVVAEGVVVVQHAAGMALGFVQIALLSGGAVQFRCQHREIVLPAGVGGIEAAVLGTFGSGMGLGIGVGVTRMLQAFVGIGGVELAVYARHQAQGCAAIGGHG